MANPVDRNQLANTMMMLFRGGAGGGDPYANESSGPFATSPRIYGRSQGAPAAAAAAPVARAPVPSRKPKQGGAGKARAAPGPNNVPLPVMDPRNSPTGTYTIGAEGNMPNPESLIGRMQPRDDIPSPGPGGPSPMPYGGPMAAADAAPGGAGYQAPSHNLGLWGTNPFTTPPTVAQQVSAGFPNNPGLRLGKFQPTPITNPAQQGPSPDAYYRMLMGGSGRGQMGT